MIRRRAGLLATSLIAVVAISAGARAASPSAAPVEPSPEASPGSGVATCALPPELPRVTDEPAPPPHFDPSVVAWTGDRFGYQEDGIVGDPGSGAWTGWLDGSGFREIPEAGLNSLRIAPSGTVVAQRRGALVVIGVDGAERTLLPSGVSRTFALDADGETAFVWRSRHPDVVGSDGDIWRVPLDGTSPELMLRSVPGVSVLVASPDETAVAVGWRFSDGGAGRKTLRAVGHTPIRTAGEAMLGFDWAGRLVAGDPQGLVRIDPRTGRRSRLLPGVALPDHLRLTSSGRHLVGYDIPPGDGYGDATLRVFDLVDGDDRIWQLPADSDWHLSDLTTDRYVLLWRDNDDPDMTVTATEWAVVDLLEGWLGFITFCPPFYARPAPPP